jgi:hypothetical protein
MRGLGWGRGSRPPSMELLPGVRAVTLILGVARDGHRRQLPPEAPPTAVSLPATGLRAAPKQSSNPAFRLKICVKGVQGFRLGTDSATESHIPLSPRQHPGMPLAGHAHRLWTFSVAAPLQSRGEPSLCCDNPLCETSCIWQHGLLPSRCPLPLMKAFGSALPRALPQPAISIRLGDRRRDQNGHTDRHPCERYHARSGALGWDQCLDNGEIPGRRHSPRLPSRDREGWGW